jgi:hypothetical protein
MELFKDITQDPKEVAEKLFTYITTFETETSSWDSEWGNYDKVENLSQNCSLQLSIAIVNIAIECCSGLYDDILSVEYGKFEEQDVERYNWLCKIRKHLENNLQDENNNN